MLPMRVGCKLLLSLRLPSALDRQAGCQSKAGAYENLKIGQELGGHGLATSVILQVWWVQQDLNLRPSDYESYRAVVSPNVCMGFITPA